MAHGPSQNRSRSQNEVREPNLIPIMNLFIVVIPMLMTIMVTVHLAMIEITLPTEAAGGGGNNNTQEQMDDVPKAITLALYPDRFEIMVEGIKDIITIPQLSAGKYDYIALDKSIAHLKINNEMQGTIDVLPAPTVKFDTLLRSIDICKNNNFPNIKYLTSATKLYKAK